MDLDQRKRDMGNLFWEEAGVGPPLKTAWLLVAAAHGGNGGAPTGQIRGRGGACSTARAVVRNAFVGGARLGHWGW